MRLFYDPEYTVFPPLIPFKENTIFNLYFFVSRKYLNNFRICENKINIPLWICCEDSNNENIILLSINEKDLSRSVVYKKGIINLNLFSQHLTKFKNKHLSLYDNFEIKVSIYYKKNLYNKISVKIYWKFLFFYQVHLVKTLIR